MALFRFVTLALFRFVTLALFRFVTLAYDLSFWFRVIGLVDSKLCIVNLGETRLVVTRDENSRYDGENHKELRFFISLIINNTQSDIILTCRLDQVRKFLVGYAGIDPIILKIA
jgi:hypothetical protein